MQALSLCLVFIMLFCGCSQKLRTLMNVSSEQARQASYVKSQNAKLSLLIKDVEARRLKKGLTEEQVIDYYGEPLLVKEEKGQRVFLYRDAAKFFPEEKVYIYFDSSGKLTDFILEETKPAEEAVNPK